MLLAKTKILITDKPYLIQIYKHLDLNWFIISGNSVISQYQSFWYSLYSHSWLFVQHIMSTQVSDGTKIPNYSSLYNYFMYLLSYSWFSLQNTFIPYDMIQQKPVMISYFNQWLSPVGDSPIQKTKATKNSPNVKDKTWPSITSQPMNQITYGASQINLWQCKC